MVATLAFSPLLPAAIGGAMAHAVAVAIASEPAWPWSVLASCGAFVVYGVDRVRDVERDRETSPARAAFFARHARLVWLGIALSGLATVAVLVRAPLAILAACAATGLLGLLHRRLKRYAAVKALYVSLAWTVVCVGIPALAGGDGPVLRLGFGLFLCFVANLIASNLRDDEAQLLRDHPGRALHFARLFAASGLALVASTGGDPRALAWIPAAELAALLFYRPTEHYGHIAVDGALLAGATLALATLHAS